MPKLLPAPGVMRSSALTVALTARAGSSCRNPPGGGAGNSLPEQRPRLLPGAARVPVDRRHEPAPQAQHIQSADGLGDDMPSLTNVALSRNSDGHLEVLAASTVAGSEPTLWHAQEDPDGQWSGWRPFGNPGHSRPTTVSVMPHVTDGRLEAFTATERDPSRPRAWWPMTAASWAWPARSSRPATPWPATPPTAPTSPSPNSGTGRGRAPRPLPASRWRPAPCRRVPPCPYAGLTAHQRPQPSRGMVPVPGRPLPWPGRLTVASQPYLVRYRVALTGPAAVEVPCGQTTLGSRHPCDEIRVAGRACHPEGR